MEIITFIVGFILGITMNRLLILIKLFLSLGTAFMILRKIHPEIILLPVRQWTIESILTGYNFWIETIVFSIISWFTFYYLTPLIIEKVIMRRLDSVFGNIFKKQLNYIFFENIFRSLITKWIRIRKRLSWKRHSFDTEKKGLYLEFREMIIYVFALSIHTLICGVYFIGAFPNYMIILISIWFLIVIYHVIYIPFANKFWELMEKIMSNELNRPS